MASQKLSLFVLFIAAVRAQVWLEWIKDESEAAAHSHVRDVFLERGAAERRVDPRHSPKKRFVVFRGRRECSTLFKSIVFLKNQIPWHDRNLADCERPRVALANRKGTRGLAEACPLAKCAYRICSHNPCQNQRH
jgi:hypothetical protein